MEKWLPLAALLFLGIPSTLVAQTPARIKARSELVVVPVTVKDDRGHLVSDLERSDFRVFEDGAEQEISLFSADPFPLSVAVVVDDSLPTKLVDAAQQSLMSVAGAFGPNDEVGLIVFDQFTKTLLPLTTSNDELFTQLKRLRLGSTFSEPTPSGPLVGDQGPIINGRTITGAPPIVPQTPDVGTSIDDAVRDAANMLRSRGRDRRKMILLIADGNNSKTNKWSYDANLELLLSSDIAVYSVVVGTNYLKLDRNHMTKYADATGGDAAHSANELEIERLYSDFSEEARNQYTIAYVPHRAGKSRNYHSIEVRVRRPGLKVYARQGYYTGVVQ
jgi:VWFA-related protein